MAAGQRQQRQGPVVKIITTAHGLHRIEASSIAAAMGETVSEVKQLLQSRLLTLHNNGQPVAAQVADDASALFFYAQAIDTPYTHRNVYWLRRGGLLAMATMAGAPPVERAPGVGSYRAITHAKGNRYALPHLFDDPDDDFWMWALRYENQLYPSCATDVHPCSVTAFQIASPGRALSAAAPGRLTVRLHGGSETDGPLGHSATVIFNGVELGMAQWEGIAPLSAVFEVPAALLNDGENTVEINGTKAGVAALPSVFYINDLQLAYSRRFVADNNQLTLTSGGRKEITVSGFTGTVPLVLEVHHPRTPRVLTQVRSGGEAGARDVSFAVQPDGRQYVVSALEAAGSAVEVVADVPSNLRSPTHQAEHLIIATDPMTGAAEELAAHRRAQGLTSMVVDIEDIYDEFNYGVESAEAVWSFLHYAYSHWEGGPRYVVLAGEGSIDYRVYLGGPSPSIPALLTPTPQGLYPSDNLFADVTGNDGLGEFALGRLPAVNAAELSAVIAKIIAYENGAGAWQPDVLMVADKPDGGGDFIASSEAVMALIPGHQGLDWLHLDSISTVEAREQLRARLSEGRALVNFFGHGGITSLGTSAVFTAADIASLNKGARLPVVTAFASLAGQFTAQGIDSLAEVLLVSPDRGVAAVWSASGLSFNQDAQRLSEGFYSALLIDGERVLGEAILSAQRHYAQTNAARYVLDLYNLFGDPATVMK